MRSRTLILVRGGLLLCMLCLLQSGCAYWNPLESYLDEREYKADVRRYERNGFDEKTAKRKAFDNEFFKKMERER